MEREFDQLKKREEKFLLMHRAQVEMAAVRNRKELLIMIVNTAAALTGAEGVSLYLLEPGNKLMLKAVKKAGKTGAEFIDDMIPAKTIFFPYRFKEKLLDTKEIRLTTGDAPTSLTGSFLRFKEEKLGEVNVYHCNPGRKFSKEDEDFLEFFSQFASAAISNTRESSDYQEPDPLESLLTISQSMLSERNLPILLEVIARNALQVLGADMVVLYEYNAAKKDVVLPPILQGSIKHPETLKVKRETHKESLIFKMINLNEPFYAPDAGEDWEILFTSGKKKEDKEGNFVHREGIYSSAGIPLMINNELVGILFINYRKPCSFPPALKKKIELFSNEAAIAIGNAKIFSQNERYISELNVLNNINREISSSVTLEIKEILSLIYKQIGRLMDVTNFFAALYDKDSDIVSFELAIEDGKEQEVGVGKFTARKTGNALTEHVIRSKKSLLIEENLDQWFMEYKVDFVGAGTKCWLGVPMILENEVLGIIVVQDEEKEHAYDQGNRKILETIASYAAVAIGNARLLQTSRNQVAQLEGLNRISQEIISSSMNIQSVFRTILAKAVELSNSDAGQIFFYDESAKLIKAVFTHHSDELKKLVIKYGEGMPGIILRTGKPLFTNDYVNEAYKLGELNQPKFREKIKGVVQVPLKWRDELLGILALSYKPGSNRLYSNKDVEFLNLFAGVASIAIGIARNISFQKTLLNNNPDAIIAVDRKGFITLFNNSSEKMIGIPKNDIIGKQIFNCYFDGESEARRINRLLFEGEKKGIPVKNMRTALKGADGKRIPILLTGAILRSELNERIGSIGILTDIKEIELDYSIYRIQQLFLTEIDQYPQNIAINSPFDLQKGLTEILNKVHEFCQTEYVVLFGSTSENALVLKAVAWAGIPGRIEQKLPHFNWREAGLLEEGTLGEIILKNELDRIERWWPTEKWKNLILTGIRGHNADFFKTISCGIPVRLADNYRAVLVFGPFSSDYLNMENADFIRNLSKRINIHALSWLQALYLREKNRESERSIKLIIHRSRTFLQHIIGKFSLILRNLKDDDKDLKEYAREGERLVSNLSRVVKRALTSPIADMEPTDFDFQPYPLPALIQNSVENFKERARKEGREIEIDSSIENLPYADIDNLLFSMALGNLIDNALKYSYKNTTVEISSKYDTKKEKVKIIIRDLGEQMSEAARKNLEQPGTRWGMTTRAQLLPGTGFGLWEANFIASAHRGNVHFSSVYEGQLKAHRVEVSITIPVKQTKESGGK